MSNNGNNESKTLKLAALEVSVNSVNKSHTFRELTLITLAVQPAQKIITDTVRETAPHYHALGVQIETKVAVDNPDCDKVTIAAKTKEIFEGYIQNEIDWLKSEKNWESDAMPYAAKVAIQKITNALGLGGSLRELQTVSQCEKFSRDTRKAINKKAADEFEKSGKLAGGDSNDAPLSLDVSDEAKQALAKAMRNFEKLYQQDSKVAIDMVNGWNTRMAKHIEQLAAHAVARAMKVA